MTSRAFGFAPFMGLTAASLLVFVRVCVVLQSSI